MPVARQLPTKTPEEEAEILRRRMETLAKYPSLGGNNSSLIADNSSYHLPSKITDIDKVRLEEEKAEHMDNARFKEVNGATYFGIGRKKQRVGSEESSSAGGGGGPAISRKISLYY